MKKNESNLFLILIILHSFFFEYLFWPIAHFFNLTEKKSDLSVWKWSLIDNLPYLERKTDPSFLLNDFITNSMNKTFSLRNFFNDFILFFSDILDFDYYSVLYFFDKVIVLALPLLIFIFIKKSAKKLFNKSNEIVPFCAVILFSNPITSNYFEIAGLEPFALSLLPYTLSLLICTISFITIEKYFYIGLLLNIIGIIFHVQIGVFFAFITPLIYFHFFKTKFKYFIMWVIFILSTIAFLKLNYIDYEVTEYAANSFILRHQKHYDINYIIDSNSNILKFILLLTFSIVLVFCQKKRVMPSILIFSIIASILAHYFATNVLNYSALKVFAPIRFVMFLPIFTAIFLTPYVNYNSLKIPKWFVYILFLFGLIILISQIDNPKKDLYNKDKQLYDFIRSTDKESVFFTDYSTGFYNTNHSYLNQNIRVIGRRSVLISREWPFNFENIPEYNSRSKLMKINYPQKNNYIKCEDLIKANKHFGLSHLVTFEENSCNFLQKIYHNSEIYIYSFK